jgi:hypothetical protein
MTPAAVQSASIGAGSSGGVPQAAASKHHALSFHDFLSAMNPLQYLPVVGTIYRAATGDTISEPLRQAGSMLASGLLGGPIGLITNIASTIAQKVTGIDPEKIAASFFHPSAPATPKVPETATVEVQTPTAVPALEAASGLALSPRQLAAYGVHSDVAGNLRLGTIEGADVLNVIEQARHGDAAAAYAANMALPVPAGTAQAQQARAL